MSRWFRKITEDKNDLTPVIDAMEAFQREYEGGLPHLQVRGRRIAEVASEIPSYIEYYNTKMLEVDMILKYLEQLVEERTVEKTMWYMSHYNRALSESTAKRYAEVHEEVMDLKRIVSEVAVMRNQFLSLTKGLDTLHYQIKNIVTLRSVGFEDAVF